MEYSFLFSLMQKLWKSIKKCKTFSRKATGLFFSGHSVHITVTFLWFNSNCLSCHLREDTNMHESKTSKPNGNNVQKSWKYLRTSKIETQFEKSWKVCVSNKASLPSVLLNISSDKFIRLYGGSDNVVCTSLRVNFLFFHCIFIASTYTVNKVEYIHI